MSNLSSKLFCGIIVQVSLYHKTRLHQCLNHRWKQKQFFLNWLKIIPFFIFWVLYEPHAIMIQKQPYIWLHRSGLIFHPHLMSIHVTWWSKWVPAQWKMISTHFRKYFLWSNFRGTFLNFYLKLNKKKLWGFKCTKFKFSEFKRLPNILQNC